MSNSTILIIEDEAHIRRVVRNALEKEFGKVLEAASGDEGVDLAAAARPDLIVLDLGLPDRPGQSVCREIRKWTSIPIIVLSAQHSESEKVALLDAGADDYLTKPFSTLELQARVRAQLRRSSLGAIPGSSGPVTVAGLLVDPALRKASRNGVDIRLTKTEWALLRLFLSNAGRVLTHEHIFREVWGKAEGDPQSYLRVHVANLRRKIEADSVRPELIITEPGVGYRFRSID